MDKLEKASVRAALLFAYEAAVVKLAKDRGGNPKHFGEAAAMLPPAVFDALRHSYRQQVDSLEKTPTT